MNTRCAVCSEDKIETGHEETRKHQKNVLLDQLSKNKKNFTENRNGLVILCTVRPTAYYAELQRVDDPQHVLKASVKPNAEVKFSFSITNNNDHDIVLDGVTMLPTNIVNFNMINNNMGLGAAGRTIQPRSNFEETVEITFENAVIGTYSMPVFFFFSNEERDESTIIIKEMFVFVETVHKTHEKVNSPYTRENVFAERIVPTTAKRCNNDIYEIPSKDHRTVFSRDLKDVEDATDEQKALNGKIKAILKMGPSQENYTEFFHNLLWFEETFLANNLKNYNMTGVTLFPRGKAEKSYAFHVPGLAEKRPSLMIGDLAHVRPNGQTEVLFEAVITEIEDNYAVFSELNREFKGHNKEKAKFDIRFFLSRLPLERMHVAVQAQPQHAIERAFPRARQPSPSSVKPITKFYNKQIEKNPEQRAVVSHIVAGSSGTAPYLLFGPPGTGKTVTIVEAILQLASNPKNQILVCTDSNKAADHVASVLIQYREFFDEEQFILRANSEFRIWKSFPECLAPYSNGTNRGSWYPVSIQKFRSHRIVITTLIHAAKFAGELKREKDTVQRVTTHLFIDEAAQASEPAALVPLCGLLAPAGQLVLAGDPMQLGPVVISREASKLGLGMSLMERLKLKWPLYAEDNPNYIMMLKKNFRSHADILSISDQLFYNNQLEALAPFDAISERDILLNDANAKSRAIVFHGVLSKEQRMGKSPSFYNSMELEIIQTYVKGLVENHRVAPQDIGVITPYIRQVCKIQNWLTDEGLEDIEVGTVEGYQGMEKRVIIISTVRANCDLFAYDAKYRLGFIVDPKRFNVALTRAKAKLVVIGNPLCLKKDSKWTMYMQKCRDFGTYTGFDGGPLREENEDAMLNQLTPILRAMTRALAHLTL